MIQYDAKNRIVIMSLVDLEHCGFDWDEFDAELSLSGIDAKAARWPIALIVDFAGGAVITPNTLQVTIEKMRRAHEKFKAIVASIRAGSTKGGYRRARGAIPWREGDEPGEVVSRRMRDHQEEGN